MHYPHGSQVSLTMKALMIFEVSQHRQAFDNLTNQSGRLWGVISIPKRLQICIFFNNQYIWRILMWNMPQSFCVSIDLTTNDYLQSTNILHASLIQRIFMGIFEGLECLWIFTMLLVWLVGLNPTRIFPKNSLVHRKFYHPLKSLEKNPLFFFVSNQPNKNPAGFIWPWYWNPMLFLFSYFWNPANQRSPKSW